ncbi:MAG: hypothetical protein J6J05_09375 [Peptococcaceae bacterium]|nr:hypothetical protein [Peptococcaceae bacterium]MBP3626018.1 hypothetical protein [Peptococcaceae bacterium]
MKNMKRIALVVAITLLLGCAIGGTMAWLIDDTDPVVNTFTTSDVDITLTETDSDDTDTDANNNSYKMVPGAKIAKDPKVTVTADSEDCYVFVKVEKTGGVVKYIPAGSTEEKTSSWDDFLSYTIDDGDEENSNNWVELTGVTGLSDGTKIYYKIFDANSKNVKGTAYSILNSNQVTVKDAVTKEMMKAINESNPSQKPVLTFTAYAIQMDNLPYDENADEAAKALTAWNLVPKN